MATNTYVALRTETVSSVVTSVTFSSIPQGYTDLVLVASMIQDGTATAQNTFIQLNSSITGYSRTNLRGNGSVPSTFRNPDLDRMALTLDANASNQVFSIFNFMNYSNPSTFKTIIARQNKPIESVDVGVYLWQDISPIETISITASDNRGSGTADKFAVGSTFSLYGIKAQVTPGTAKATGGTITYDNFGRVIHTFTSSGTFTPSEALSCDYLVVAGGGGGAGNGNISGAGGRNSSSTLSAEASTNYAVTIGAGGAFGATGSSSTFSVTTNTGGIGGTSGGTGGGGGGAGGTPGSPNGSVGGNGSVYSISGTSTYYGGGGGGASESTTNRSAGGLGGGALGSNTGANRNGTNGTVNLGGGGSAGGSGGGFSSSGGSGLVIIRYQG